MLTTAQIATLKTAMNADINLSAFILAKDAQSIANYYNGNGATLIWRPSIAVSELNTAIVWSEYAGLTSVLQQTYIAMIAAGFVDATSANIRGGFSTVFTGKVSLTNLLTLAQRTATKLEELFTISGVCSIFGYKANVTDIGAALV